MSSSIEMAKGRIIKFVQDLILDEAERSAITAGLISEKID
jgi:hypothetical protein